jgi:ABC-type uncharacterized transport system substrate-binding protein
MQSLRKSCFIVFILIFLVLIFNCGKKGKEKLYTIGVVQFSSSELADEAVQGVSDALTEAGYINWKNCYIDYKNAQGDFSTAQSIAQKFVTDKVDIIITVTTPCLQVTASENKTIPHIFGAVTDPFRMGIAEDPEHHQSNITGIATFQPVDETIELITTVLPETKNIGVIWNPSEACSEACTEMMRKSVKSRNLILTEITVTNSSEVLTAAQCLAEKNVDVIFISGDNTVITALDAVIAVGEDKYIPVVTNNPSNTEKGAFFSLGADYYIVGKETSKLAVRVIKGEKPADLPIQKLVPKKLWINNKVANDLNILFPEDILKKANKVIE